VPEIANYTSNPLLPTIKPGWKGTPIDKRGRFVNHEYPFNLDYQKVVKLWIHRNPKRAIKQHDPWRIPILKDDRWLTDTADKIVWLGHASFFIQLSNIRILIDPIFGRLPIGRRYSEMPVTPDKFLKINYVLISHAHYDHCDKSSVKLIVKNNPGAQILTGLKLDHLVGKWTGNKIQTAGWYQQYQVDPELKITFLPSRHWSNRNLFDQNVTLWGGFMIEKGRTRIYYSGDSGFGTHFRDVGALFQGINVSLIGVGAYEPEWFMGPMHQTPSDAVRAFRATGAKTFIPFHYGTFDLSDELLGEPEQVLNKLQEEGEIQKELRILMLGEVFRCWNA
jgi:L-ascorbate metabolism protein UlaG (beta-lactamase superfamily)